MPYYRGDYYRGDYYRGDLLGSLKKLGKAVIGGVTGFIGGGPVGAIAGAVGGLVKSGGAPAPMLPLTPGIVQGSIGGTILRGVAKQLPGIAIGAGIEKGLGLFGRNGDRKRRTMNHLNPKALTRATRRVEGFVKKARKAVSPLGYTVVRRGSSRCVPRTTTRCVKR